MSFVAGLIVGDLVWFTLAATGMAVLLQAAHGVFMVVKFVGVAYLLFLAYRAWISPVLVQGQKEDGVRHLAQMRQFFTSIALTLGNPKAMLFYLALLPSIIDLQRMTLVLYAQVVVAICVILSGVFSCYALAANRVRLLFRRTGAILWLNRVSGAVMGGAAVTIAAR